MRSYFFQRIVLGPGIVEDLLSGRVAVEHNPEAHPFISSLNGFALDYADDIWQRGGEPGVFGLASSRKIIGRRLGARMNCQGDSLLRATMPR